MTIQQILEAKAIREVHVAWFLTKEGEQFFMSKNKQTYCKVKHQAFAYTEMLDAEKRCLGIYAEVACQDIEDIGVDTIYVGDGITIG